VILNGITWPWLQDELVHVKDGPLSHSPPRQPSSTNKRSAEGFPKGEPLALRAQGRLVHAKDEPLTRNPSRQPSSAANPHKILSLNLKNNSYFWNFCSKIPCSIIFITLGGIFYE